MKKLPISLICGAAIMFITAVMYFVICDEIFTQMIILITLAGVLLAEFATALMAFLSKGEPRKVASTVIIGLMVPASLILSIVNIKNSSEDYLIYFGIYFALFALFGTAAIVLWVFSAKKAGEAENFQNAKTNMLNMRKIVKAAMLDASPELMPSLEKLEEKLHFSNDSVIAAQDSAIYDMLFELRNNIKTPDYNASEMIAKIEKAVDERNIFSSRTV